MNNQLIKIKFEFPKQAVITEFKPPSEIIISKSEKVEIIKKYIINVYKIVI